MNDSPYSTVVSELVLPDISAVLLIVLVVALIYRLFAGLAVREVLGFSIAYGFLGGISGLIAGATSEPIVGAFLTGLLGLVSGALSFSLAKPTAPSEDTQMSSDVRLLVGASIVVLCLTALVGLAIGRVYQTKWVTYEREYAQIKDLNEKVNMPLAKLWKQHEYCRSRVKDPSACDALLYQVD